jgi:MFS family permease
MNTIFSLVRDWFRLARSANARLFLLIALFTDGAFLFVFLVAIQSYLHGGGLGLPGYALAAYGAAKLTAQLFAGRLIDRLGSARAAQIGLAVIAIGQAALLAGIVTPNAVLPAAAVYGLGSAVLWPALYARASRQFPQEDRAKLGAALTVTTGIALILGLGLGLALPAGFPYVAATMIALVAVVLAAIAATRLQGSGTELQDTEELGAVGLRDLVTKALDPPRLGFAVFVLFESAAIGSLQAIFRSYGRDLLGISFRHELLLLAPAALLGAGAVVLGGALADRLGRLRLLSIGFITAGLALWLLSDVARTAALVPLAALGGVGAGLAMPSMTALSMDLSRTAGQGTVLAWFMMMEGLGHAGGAALGGWINASADPASVLRLAATLFLAIGAGAVASLAWGNLANGQRWGASAKRAARWAPDVRCEK